MHQPPHPLSYLSPLNPGVLRFTSGHSNQLVELLRFQIIFQQSREDDKIEAWSTHITVCVSPAYSRLTSCNNTAAILSLKRSSATGQFPGKMTPQLDNDKLQGVEEDVAVFFSFPRADLALPVLVCPCIEISVVCNHCRWVRSITIYSVHIFCISDTPPKSHRTDPVF